MRILAFGDNFGMPQLQRLLPAETLVGVVGAEIRPQYFDLLKDIAAACSVPFLVQPRPASPAYPDFVRRVRDLTPDLIIVHSYSMLIRPEILTIPPLGAVNIHGALLPQYRGSNPLQWALLNDEIETGVTMHYMDENFDTGDIIAQRRVPIHFEDTWREVQTRIIVATETLLAEELPKLLNGTNTRQSQDESRAQHYHRRKPEDGLFNWDNDLLYIYNLIRALVKPHPGAFYIQEDGNRVVLDEYVPIPKLATMKYGANGNRTLQTENIRLEPIPPENLEEQKKRSDSNDLLIFAIRLRTSGELIGSCQLHSLNYVHRTAELQIQPGESAGRGHGYETEATKLLLDFAFRDLNLRRVSLHVFSNNAVAIRMYEKAGFLRDGALRKAAQIDGNTLDVLVMGILQEEYDRA